MGGASSCKEDCPSVLLGFKSFVRTAIFNPVKEASGRLNSLLRPVTEVLEGGALAADQ